MAEDEKANGASKLTQQETILRAYIQPALQITVNGLLATTQQLVTPNKAIEELSYMLGVILASGILGELKGVLEQRRLLAEAFERGMKSVPSQRAPPPGAQGVPMTLPGAQGG